MKGYELLKEIADGKIKEGTRIEHYREGVFYLEDENFHSEKNIDDYGIHTSMMSLFTDVEFANEDFEIISDEIDIDKEKEEVWKIN